MSTFVLGVGTLFGVETQLYIEEPKLAETPKSWPKL